MILTYQISKRLHAAVEGPVRRKEPENCCFTVENRPLGIRTEIKGKSREISTGSGFNYCVTYEGVLISLHISSLSHDV